jgi:2-phosphosulfolactate phosphatase
MKIRVALLPSELTRAGDGAAAVIDVLRATTVITQALHAGASEIVVCSEIDDAFELAASGDEPSLLCGERACKPIEGFDLGNSPAEYTKERVSGKRLVMTTTNGTRAVIAAAEFRWIYAASFNNLSAIVSQLATHDDVSIICAGTDGAQTEEDVLLAGAILHQLLNQSQTGDATAEGEAAAMAMQHWHTHLKRGRPLAATLQQTLGGRNLLAAGYRRDIEACAGIDSTDAVATITHRDPLTFRRLLRCEQRS